MANTERKRCIEGLEAMGWVAHPRKGSNYVKYKCTCGGRHLCMLKSTPSGADYYKNRLNDAENQCARWRAEQEPDGTE